PDVAHLLLAQPLDFLEVVEVLLDAEAIGGGTQDLLGRQARVGAEQRQPAVVLPDQHDADAPARRPPGRLERLDTLVPDLAVLVGRHHLPAALLAGALGQADPPRPVHRRPPAPAAPGP